MANNVSTYGICDYYLAEAGNEYLLGVIKTELQFIELFSLKNRIKQFYLIGTNNI